MRVLERGGLLDRKVSTCRSTRALAEHHQRGLRPDAPGSSPSAAVVLKVALNQQLVEIRRAIGDPYLGRTGALLPPGSRAASRARSRGTSCGADHRHRDHQQPGQPHGARASCSARSRTPAATLARSRAYSVARDRCACENAGRRSASQRCVAAAAAQHAMHDATARLLPPRHLLAAALSSRPARCRPPCAVRTVGAAELGGPCPRCHRRAGPEGWVPVMRRCGSQAGSAPVRPRPRGLQWRRAGRWARPSTWSGAGGRAARGARRWRLGRRLLRGRRAPGLDWLRAGVESSPVDGNWQAVAAKRPGDATRRCRRGVAGFKAPRPGGGPTPARVLCAGSRSQRRQRLAARSMTCISQQPGFRRALGRRRRAAQAVRRLNEPRRGTVCRRSASAITRRPMH